jgi:lipopolysaccharide/colanic/teichoic acid biosynthesis glycosyltransferase
MQPYRHTPTAFPRPDVTLRAAIDPVAATSAAAGANELPSALGATPTLGTSLPVDWAADAGASPIPVPAERVELLTRVLNVVVAAVALLLLAPICVLVAIAVKLTSAGPVFYTQTRVGIDRRWNPTRALNERRVEDLGGQPFTILKFRSMTVNAEANGQAVWATKDDARVTPVGRILRKTRLDEIPQLINVLRGEMNIVGPRPERPSIVVRLREQIPDYPHRHRVKPGITGWAQINHDYDSSLEDVRKKLQYDLAYMTTQSVWFDLKIMVLTIPVMLLRRGAH